MTTWMSRQPVGPRTTPMDMSTLPLSRLSSFDPKYDPLVARTPGHGRDYAPTYWVGTAGTPPPDDGPLAGDQDVDVAIVGSGFTGLATPLFLAPAHGIPPPGLQTHQNASGGPSRNGGHGPNATARAYL